MSCFCIYSNCTLIWKDNTFNSRIDLSSSTKKNTMSWLKEKNLAANMPRILRITKTIVIIELDLLLISKTVSRIGLKLIMLWMNLKGFLLNLGLFGSKYNKQFRLLLDPQRVPLKQVNEMLARTYSVNHVRVCFNIIWMIVFS